MKTKALIAAAAAVTLTASLAACTPGGGGGSANPAPTNCTNKIVNKDAEVVSVWAWYPNMAKVVDNFNNSHDDLQVCWTVAGQGAEEYAKFQTAVSAGKGAPDVVMLETDQITGFAIQNALLDISDLGANDVKGNFSEGAWGDVSQGDAVYGIPIDGGPMAMIYRKDIFDKYKITPPTTWEEYEEAAQKVADAGGPKFGDLGSNVPAVITALMQQNGATPFVYDLASPKDIEINLNTPEVKEVLDYWAGLVEKDLIGTEDQFTTDYISGVIGGDYATYVSAAWAPGYLTGAGVGQGDDAGLFKVAPLPQWEGADAVSVNWGGSVLSVTSQARDKENAAKVAVELYADEASLTDGWKTQTIFPLNQDVLTSDEFINNEVEFFGGQTANKDVYIPAADAYEGFNYSPFTVYYYAQLQAQIVKINAKEISGSEAADALHDDIVKYAKEQGFTVK